MSAPVVIAREWITYRHDGDPWSREWCTGKHHHRLPDGKTVQVTPRGLLCYECWREARGMERVEC